MQCSLTVIQGTRCPHGVCNGNLMWDGYEAKCLLCGRTFRLEHVRDIRQGVNRRQRAKHRKPDGAPTGIR